MLKAIIFDMDRCIFDTPSSNPKDVITTVLVAIKKADVNNEISEEKLDIIGKELWRNGLPGIIHWNNIPNHIAKVMQDSFREPVADETIKPFDDVKVIEQLTQTKILVTAGHAIYQESKIKYLGIKKYFKECIINKTDNVTKKITKKPIFENLLQKYNWQPSEVMVIGDNPNDELWAGKELGMVTVQSLRPTVIKAEGFDYYIKTFKELPMIIKKL